MRIWLLAAALVSSMGLVVACGSDGGGGGTGGGGGDGGGGDGGDDTTSTTKATTTATTTTTTTATTTNATTTTTSSGPPTTTATATTGTTTNTTSTTTGPGVVCDDQPICGETGQEPDSCLNCALSTECAPAVQACQQECQDFLACLDPCSQKPEAEQQACYEACVNDNPQGAEDYFNLLGCVYCQACPTACKDVADQICQAQP